MALIQTLDFITPILDDPRQYGRVAAANSISDVYAMGGRPITAMSIVCFPAGDLDFEVLGEILQGACDAVLEAGAVLSGGHTVDDPQLKFGLSVNGIVRPGRMFTNAAARAGDVMVLTKPLGAGIVTTGIKRGKTQPAHEAAVTASMCKLNAGAAEAGQRVGVRCATDVTGFGLAGHLHQVARESGLAARLWPDSLPALPGALELAREGVVTGGEKRNFAYVEEFTDLGSLRPEIRSLILDPQTSGGLLMAVPANRVDELVRELKSEGTLCAVPVGEFVEGRPGELKV